MHSTRRFCKFAFACALSLFSLTAVPSYGQVLWQLGEDDNGWPFNAANPGDGGGPFATFVQEANVNPLPGDPASPEADVQADDDYYFEGVYTQVIPANGEYEPVGIVAANEEAMERAFAGTDNEKRIHFNLPSTLQPTNLLSVTFDMFNLDTSGTDPHYGIEVYFNGVKVQDEIVIRSAQIDRDYTTRQFTLQEVGAAVGPEFDNIVTLRGINYSADGGGSWMGIDYVQLNQETVRIPAPVYPWAVGKDDDAWPAGVGGGENASFVLEDAVTNPLPGSAVTADNDYYLAGNYTNVIAGNGTYEPVGAVSENEASAERAITTANTELRYHFNLPNDLVQSSLMTVKFDALSLDTSASDPRFGIQVLVNGVLVQPEIMIRPAQLGTDFTTAQFSVAGVNALLGPGQDNVVTLRGVSYAGSNGGNFIGIDYVQLNPVLAPIPQPIIPWSVGQNDNAHPAGNGGGPFTTFVQENGQTNALPGVPNSPEVNQQADDDYYFAGVYSTVIAGNGTYTPVGEVRENEEAAERAFAGEDNYLRYHFNLPAALSPTDQLSISFDALSLDTSAADPHYGVEVYFNGVKVMDEAVIRAENLGTTYSTPVFTLAQVNAQPGFGFDNIITLKGINYNATEGGGSWMGIDYIQLNSVIPAPFPWSVGKDDNAQPTTGNGGGPNTSFMQENGSINPLPGNPANAEVNQQSDNDYYFAGTYSNAIPSVVAELGDYTPLGQVLVNEESAERAFAGGDNDMRYHFNLPANLALTNQLVVSFDIFSLDTSAADPHYGVEVWVNSVKVMDEVVIRPENIDQDYVTLPFTLASVNAQVGPGYDNIVSLRGINYNSTEAGGNWMGIDYVNLDPVPTPIFPIEIGKDDNDWTTGDGGGANATFVQENGNMNDLPGNPRNREIAQQADNDYYLAGIYTNVIAANGTYEPTGIVPRNEEAAERAFVPTDTDLRYHFNLPSTLKPTNLIQITFDALNLQDPDDTVTDPRFGIEVYFNGVKVQDEILIRTNNLDTDYTTPAFTLASVGAQVGSGTDNIVTLKGVPYNAEGGGNWMGIDYVRIHAAGDVGGQPQFTSTVLSGGNLTITWTGAGTLESTTVLGPGAQWDPVTPAPAGNTYTTSATTGNRFFRIRR